MGTTTKESSPKLDAPVDDSDSRDVPPPPPGTNSLEKPVDVKSLFPGADEDKEEESEPESEPEPQKQELDTSAFDTLLPVDPKYKDKATKKESKKESKKDYDHTPFMDMGPKDKESDDSSQGESEQEQVEAKPQKKSSKKKSKKKKTKKSKSKKSDNSEQDLTPVQKMASEEGPHALSKAQEIERIDNWIEEKLLQNWTDKQITEGLEKKGVARHIAQLCHRRVLRKFQEQGTMEDHVEGYVANMRDAFDDERKIGEALVAPSTPELTAEHIAQLDHWIEDKIRKGWDDHKIQTELLKQGWAHDSIRDSQLRMGRKISGKPKFGESDEKKSGLGQFIGAIRKTFKREEDLSEKLIEDISTDEESQEQLSEKLEEQEEKIKQSSKKDTAQDKQIVGVQTKVERLDAQMGAMSEFRKVVNERFMRVAQDSGNLRGNIVNLEKDITEITGKISKAIDLVEAVQPQALFTEVKKTDAKLEAQKARIESAKEISDTIMKELKDIRSKLGVVRGVEQIMKIHDDIKDTFSQVQQMKTLAERHADKVETMFMELKKRMAQVDGFDKTAKNMQETSTGVLKEVQKLKSRELRYITKEQLDAAITDSKHESEKASKEVEQLRSENEESAEIVQQSVIELKTELADLTQKVTNKSSQDIDALTFRLEKLEQKVRKASSQDALNPLMNALSQLQQANGQNPSMPPVQNQTSQPSTQSAPSSVDSSMSAMKEYNKELREENQQFMKYLMDLTKREFSLIKADIEGMRGNAPINEKVQHYLEGLEPTTSRDAIISSFVKLGWPKQTIEDQITFFEGVKRRRFE